MWCHLNNLRPEGFGCFFRCSLWVCQRQGDGQLDEEELLSHLWSVGYQATKVWGLALMCDNALNTKINWSCVDSKKFMIWCGKWTTAAQG